MSLKFNWKDLLVPERIDNNNLNKYLSITIADEYIVKNGGTPITEFQRDYSNIIHSASFRRLQDKTQVFPLDKSDFVRTRLTHSIEVANIAKIIGSRAINTIIAKEKLDPINDMEMIKSLQSIPTILESAGLIHDIGNPPFGHFGESVIVNWFKENLNTLQYNNKSILEIIGEERALDFELFDGNAQALRVLAKLHLIQSDFGMNLCLPILSTIIKYPSTFENIYDQGRLPIYRKKLGSFYSESELIEQITLATKTGYHRHPLTYILEVADDIAYNLADVEDAYKKGIVTFNDIKKYSEEAIEEYSKRPDKDNRKLAVIKQAFKTLEYYLEDFTDGVNSRFIKKEIQSKNLIAFQNWIAYIREWLEYSANYSFEANYETIMAGEFDFDLLDNTYHDVTLKVFRKISSNIIHPTKTILRKELAAESIITYLLDKFVPAIINYDTLKLTKVQKKYISIISENHLLAYKIAKLQDGNKGSEAHNLHLKLHIVTDFICGMTDTYAKELFSEIRGLT